MGDDRPARYEENGQIIYRASALGYCRKALVALGIGQTPQDFPDWLYERFQQGVDGEPVVLKKLGENWRMMDETDHQYQWDDGQLYVEIPVGERIVIRGHADGIGVCYKAPVLELGESEWVTGDKRLIEVKYATEDYAEVILKIPPVMYEWQISVYGGFYGLLGMLAIGIKRDGVVVNVVTQMWDKLPYSMKDIKLRVIELERMIENGEYPDCDYKQWPCPFPWLCDEVTDAKGRPRTGDNELAGVLEQSLQIRGKG